MFYEMYFWEICDGTENVWFNFLFFWCTTSETEYNLLAPIGLMLHGTKAHFYVKVKLLWKYDLIEILFNGKILLLIMIKMPKTVMNSSIPVSVVL
jgi:hypothetical protein